MGVYIYDVYQYKCISSEACGLKAVSLLFYLCVCVCVCTLAGIVSKINVKYTPWRLLSEECDYIFFVAGFTFM